MAKVIRRLSKGQYSRSLIIVSMVVGGVLMGMIVVIVVNKVFVADREGMEGEEMV